MSKQSRAVVLTMWLVLLFGCTLQIVEPEPRKTQVMFMRMMPKPEKLVFDPNDDPFEE